MCIVIDINRIPSVLNPESADHYEFEPVLTWVNDRKGKIVYGGTTYKRELRGAKRYYGILLEMRKGGMVEEVDEATVDRVEEEVRRKILHRNFNDQAIVAIVIVSRCRLVCSNDRKSFAFIKQPILYPKDFPRPRIYTGRENVSLLSDRRIVGRCGPCSISK